MKEQGGDIMNILIWIIFGAVVGYIADMLDKTVQLSWAERLFIGIVGSIAGGTLATFLTTGTFDIAVASGFDLVSIVVAVIGALLALFAWKKLKPGRSQII
jgi:uncharacterized membrane protein YeaQ/YmgE (transglycosylase-associated protein family)